MPAERHQKIVARFEATAQRALPTPEGMDDVSVDALIGIARATVAVMVREVMAELTQAILIDDRDARLRAVATIMRQQFELEQRTAPRTETAARGWGAGRG